ncbi:MAG: alpha/beta hydrolase [Imperialibacter sp.]|uniref:alpha/beta hydrolase n=1 Tax=Imperialibacter sp. TaxID=2038411 RepID=UPI0032EE491C
MAKYRSGYMTEESYDIISRDGLNLKGRSWLPDMEPSALICLVHGHGEHIGRYQHVAEFFTQQGMAVFGMDLRGHGYSEGKKGHTTSYDLLLEDVEDLMKSARVEFIETPMFLYGHSMGGNMVVNFLTSKKTLELQGAILSSPFLRLAMAPPPLLMKLAKIMRNIWPSFSASSGLDPNGISSIAAEVEKYKSDPLIHSRITSQLSLSLIEAGEKAIGKAGELNIPVLAFHGGQDEITSMDATKEFASKAPGYVTFQEWKTSKHETHYDVDREKVLGLVANWVRQQLA